MIVMLLAMFLAAVVALRDEVAVARLRALAQASPSAAVVALATAHDISANDVPPRAAMYRALARGRAASVMNNTAERRALLQSAMVDIASAGLGRPAWGEAEVARAYVYLVALGPDRDVTLQSFADSYRQGGRYLSDSAPWRLAFAVDRWSELDSDTQRRVIDEAIWFGGTSRGRFQQTRDILGDSALGAEVHRRRGPYRAP